ncbi:MAG: caspase family protein [Nitrosomonas sp.]|uniref:caspase family protein n=1 Tax=Nitrosomonas sp. TaxID=42353 RepID=UPI002733C2B8|nr:caspase family protein [Nitrosomonas sp.]MDP3662447.1 caspase family protein [Nitrosomonas sp.]MDZ4105455.1 caspase family protein [Nitrosomonas sp.]
MKKALVAIGVDKTGGLPILKAAADGANKIATWAGNQGFDITLLTDKLAPVTLAAVTASIHELINKRIYDQLVVYFSGHGLLKGSNYEVWLLSGAPINPNEAVNVTGSIDLSRNCGISHVVFISDACRSIPNTIGMNYVLGGLIFPAEQPKPPSPEVDTFYATIPGNPALEVPPDEAATNYRGIFTDYLLKPLLGHVNGLAREIATPSGPKYVIPSRSLKTYLLNVVPEAASAVSIKLQQNPEIRVESDLPKYLGELVTAMPDFAAPPGTDPSGSRVPSFGPSLRSPSTSDALEMLKQSHFLGHKDLLSTEALKDDSGQAMSREIDELLNARGRVSFETRTGFTVHGVKVVSAMTTGTLCDVFEESGVSQVRVHIDPQSPILFAYRSLSTLIRFNSGSGVCLAALPGFIGTVVVAEEGRVLSVNYTPARGTPAYGEYEQVADDLERRRAFAAVAARNGSFTLDRKEATDAARYLRMLKSVDPTLGIYAAYAYAQVGGQEGVESVYRYMSENIYGYNPPVPFDVAMLAHRNGPWPEAYRFPPTMPMLTQGWALLGGLEHSMHPAALNARHHLIPSLWTAFTTEGMDILEESMTLGDFRWI